MARKTTTEANGYAIIGGDLYMAGEYLCEAGTASAIKLMDESKFCTSIRVVSLRDDDMTYVEWIDGKWVKYHADAEYTLRREIRASKVRWYAYRRVAGTLYKRHVGYSFEITHEKLWHVAVKSLPTNRSRRVTE